MAHHARWNVSMTFRTEEHTQHCRSCSFLTDSCKISTSIMPTHTTPVINLYFCSYIRLTIIYMLVLLALCVYSLFVVCVVGLNFLFFFAWWLWVSWSSDVHFTLLSTFFIGHCLQNIWCAFFTGKLKEIEDIKTDTVNVNQHALTKDMLAYWHSFHLCVTVCAMCVVFCLLCFVFLFFLFLSALFSQQY